MKQVRTALVGRSSHTIRQKDGTSEGVWKQHLVRTARRFCKQSQILKAQKTCSVTAAKPPPRRPIRGTLSLQFMKAERSVSLHSWQDSSLKAHGSPQRSVSSAGLIGCFSVSLKGLWFTWSLRLYKICPWRDPGRVYLGLVSG